jgi:AbrB family looped-hinge helix DNA binding protein
MRATVTTGGRVTIPKAMREALGWAPGSLLEFRAVAGGVMLLEKRPAGRFARFRGHAGPGLSTDEILKLTRCE